MDKWQAQDAFWNSFGIPAYDEHSFRTVGELSEKMWITYNAEIGVVDQELTLNASIWHRSSSWAAISKKANEIAEAIKHGRMYKVDGGLFWIKSPEGSPLAQRMDSDGDEETKRIYLSVNAEALTE